MNKEKVAFNLFIVGLLMLSVALWWTGFPAVIALIVLLVAAMRLPAELKKDIAVTEMTLILLIFYMYEMFGEVQWIVFLAADYRVFTKVVLFLCYAYVWLKVFARVMSRERHAWLSRHVLLGVYMCGILYPFMLNIHEGLILWLVFLCAVIQLYVVAIFIQAVYAEQRLSAAGTEDA
ncbi:MAG: hypothetical protein ACI33P_05795 [Lysinibacillus sp.]